ncbi:kinase-like protein [Exidia glandulosa HHB12029]|uniref:Kinase-like protein n=1 Tax=Exidia glandulosa HHB12029 TaxID=1314781 RepID=A0A165KSQ5_EXIGL|nr:kinase-like protein [Exidia glandulosa HHB12029]
MPPRPLQDGRFCRSMPPWSLLDITPGFFRRSDDLPRLFVNEAFLRRFKTVEIWVELPLSTLILLNGKWVLKLIPPQWDVDTIVEHMRRARRVLPVPYVHEFGRVDNCCFIVMEYVRGFTFSVVTREHGHYAAARLKPQIAEILARLDSVGLAHNDLHPRNIIVDRHYNVVGLLDWDYAAPTECSYDEYLRRLNPRFDFDRDRNWDPEFEFPVYTEHDECWDHLFMRNMLDRGDAAASTIERFDSILIGAAKVPPASKHWGIRAEPKAVHPRSRTRHLSSYNSGKRVAMLISGSHNDWQAVLAAVSSIADICLIVVDEASQAVRMRSRSSGAPIRFLDPSVRVVPRRLPGEEPPSSSASDSDLAHAIAEARAHAVILCDWRHELGTAFWSMADVPPILGNPAKPMTVTSLLSAHDARGLLSSMQFLSLTRTGSSQELSSRTISASELNSPRWLETSRRNFYDAVARRLVQIMPD